MVAESYGLVPGVSSSPAIPPQGLSVSAAVICLTHGVRTVA
jgi:hypothetical protein